MSRFEPSRGRETGEVSIHYLDLKTGRKAEVFREERPRQCWGPTVAPDERRLYYDSEDPPPRDLSLVENFR